MRSNPWIDHLVLCLAQALNVAEEALEARAPHPPQINGTAKTTISDEFIAKEARFGLVLRELIFQIAVRNDSFHRQSLDTRSPRASLLGAKRWSSRCLRHRGWKTLSEIALASTALAEIGGLEMPACVIFYEAGGEQSRCVP